ncbi:MAG: tellurite resistance TerB family protein [Amaricoccus sp.]
MSFGDILGQIMQQGMAGQSGTQDRLQNAANSLGQGGGGGGLDQIFGQITGALNKAGLDTAGLQQGAGGFADKARDFLGKEQVGSLSGAQIGGIGALAGAILGGGLGGAARGGTMAILGTLAVSALKRAAEGRADAAAAQPQVTESEVKAITGPDAEKTLLKAMISAAKADGQIDQDEMKKIVGKISADNVTDEEKKFVLDQMSAPIDIAGLAAEARNPAQAAQIYAASILAIDADTDQEKQYLADLASALGLDATTVAQLHQMTGAKAA